MHTGIRPRFGVLSASLRVHFVTRPDVKRYKRLRTHVPGGEEGDVSGVLAPLYGAPRILMSRQSQEDVMRKMAPLFGIAATVGLVGTVISTASQKPALAHTVEGAQTHTFD